MIPLALSILIFMGGFEAGMVFAIKVCVALLWYYLCDLQLRSLGRPTPFGSLRRGLVI